MIAMEGLMEALEKEMHPDWNIEVSFLRCRQWSTASHLLF